MRTCTAIQLVTFGILATLIASSIATTAIYGDRVNGDKLLRTENVQRVVGKQGYDVAYTAPRGYILTQMKAFDRLDDGNGDVHYGGGGPGASFGKMRITGTGKKVDYECTFYGKPGK